MTTTRRQFLATTALAAVPPSLASAIDPIKRPSNKPDLKLSLAAYSYRHFLNLKKPTMTLFEFIDLAAALPLDAVELTSYYWAETTDAYLEKLQGARGQQEAGDLRRAGRQQLLRPRATPSTRSKCRS